MDTPADAHRRVAAVFSDRVAGVQEWDVPAPVEGWTARDVVGHLTSWLPGFLSGGGVDLPPGPDVEDDPAAAWWHHADAVQALLESPRAAEEFSHPHAGTRVLGEVVESFYVADVFMHTWDLARATGQDDTLDPAVCEALLAGMVPIEDAMRSSGQYGPAVPVPADASAQDRLLAFIGRDPAWTP
ncbi:TIGR03086 family metal-binding protein [Aeromicrobium chenweiae]|uniref:TIGR03086 family protein n=1 Tax=Aeromicrobium chenweiae TaxID=2079793 RepID=A0A2S0WR28_9ACTN|nr:TIGR03086 family metal-binding protein [Aeromicrobium chenweiae]AWB93767.1 TIGR03086 family protein [Aeromicrobium chenweiae]TGN30384.1 TIGR03086 family protein [Aeromicrobium chenweiae]